MAQRVRLIFDDGRVSLQLVTQTVQAKALIESHLPQLRQAFQDQSIQVGQFAVYTGEGSSHSDLSAPRLPRWIGGPERVAAWDEEGLEASRRVLAQAWQRENRVDYRA